MKRRLIILFSIVAVSTVGIVIGASSNTNNNPVSAPLFPAIATQQNPSGVIDGSANPELIPDTVAYALMFRLLSDRHTEEERNSVRSYLRMALGCMDCNNQADSRERRAADETLIDAALAVVTGSSDGWARSTGRPSRFTPLTLIRVLQSWHG